MGGLIAFVGEDPARQQPRLAKGLDRLRLRGSDTQETWSDDRAWLGHAPLAAPDRAIRSNQPMVSLSGRYLLLLNGAIYNFRRLRAELLAARVPLRTEGDSEVVLELFAREGPAMLPRLRGMFALFIWDRYAQRAFVARDPYGIKPLYVARTARGLLVGSQVRALMDTGMVSREPSPQGQAGFWMLGSVPEPYTWYRDVEPVRAGHCMWLGPGGAEAQECWWDVGASWHAAPARLLDAGDGRERMKDSVRAGLVADLPLGFIDSGLAAWMGEAGEIRDRVEQALENSVGAHLVSDMPVGVLLSGGIDSGALAGLMADAGARDLRGVTVRYEELSGRTDDELSAATLTARHYGMHHHVRTITAGEFARDFDRIVDSMDQPSVDGVNAWYACKAAAECGLGAAVSGIGGDELFQGYDSFTQLPRLVAAWRTLGHVPGSQWLARQMCTGLARRPGRSHWRHAPEWLRSVSGSWWLQRSIYAPEDLPALMGEELAEQALRSFSDLRWIRETDAAVPANPRVALSQLESTTHLRNQLLRDCDWASTHHGIELRTPLVDAWLLRDLAPLFGTFERFAGKSLLANAPSRPLPHAVAARRKAGYGLPVQRWAAGLTDGPARSWSQVVCDRYTGASPRFSPGMEAALGR